MQMEYKPKTYLKHFAHVGKGVKVFRYALVLRPEVIHLSDYVRIDDFARVEGGMGLRIGKYVHICSFASVYGGEREK